MAQQSKSSEPSSSRDASAAADPSPSICFIGAGNMSTSLIHGLLNPSGSEDGFHPTQIRVCDPAVEQITKLEPLGISTYSDNNLAIDGAQVIVLAVKPQVAGQVISQLSNLQEHQLLISIAAGINIASLSNWASSVQPIVRCMPNTPALLGAGMTALFANEHCNTAQQQLAQQILSAAGQTLWVKEEIHLDAVTAVSGSGPAYFFLLMEAMIDSGISLGLDQDTATQLTLQTAYGAALMAQQGKDAPGTLRKNVTSPGGTTEAALAVFQDNNLPEIVHSALNAANTRAATLAEEFGR